MLDLPELFAPASGANSLPATPASWRYDLEATKRFLTRALAGFGGTSDDGWLLAIHLGGTLVIAMPWHTERPTLLLTTTDHDLPFAI